MELHKGYYWPDGTGSGHEYSIRKVKDINKAIEYVQFKKDSPNLAFQAGANVGLWPIKMAEKWFDQVYTVEPEEESYECLKANLASATPNVIHQRMAVGSKAGAIGINKKGIGSHRVSHSGNKPDQIVPLTTIDEIGMPFIFIQLDLEGYELIALQGATKTIIKNKPVIMVEEGHGLAANYGIPRGAIGAFLAVFGYKLTDKAGADNIYVHKDQLHG